MLHVSKTKIAQIEAINNNLIPEWKEELKKERLTFSAAYELSGMTEDEQRETLGKFSETGELTHKVVKDMKEAKTAGQQVSESDTKENGMNPPEARAGDDYETPHPEGITSLLFLHRIRDLQCQDRNMYLMRPVQEPCRGIQDR